MAMTSEMTSKYFAEELKEGDICYAVVNELYGARKDKYWLAPCKIREIVDFLHITVDFLVPRKEFHVFSPYHNGVLAEEISNFSEDWHKLPKGWTYNTKLFTVVDVCSDGKNKQRQEAVDWTNLESLKRAVADNVWCEASDNFAGKFDADVDNHKGWMLRVKFDDFERAHARDSRTVPFNRIYKDYLSAAKCYKALLSADLMTAKMTDHDWALCELNHTLRLLQIRGKYSFEDIDKFRRYILSLDDKEFENLETKLGGSGTWLEYRTRGKKRWNPLHLEDIK